MEISELKSIIEKSGLSAYKIEKDLGISNGTLGQVLKGNKKLPEKYEASLRALVKEVDAKLVIDVPEEPISANNYAYDPEQGEVDLNDYDTIDVDSDKFVGEVMNSEYVPLKTKKQVKRPLMDIADLL